jgi:hypothetical protein
VVLYLLNCALFNAYFVCKTLNTNKKVEYKNFLLEVGKSWKTEVQNWSEPSTDDLQSSEKQTHQGGLNRTLQADCPAISDYTNWKNLLVLEKKTDSARQCKMFVAPKKRSENRYICTFCFVPLPKGSCFDKYNSVKNCYIICMQFLQYRA